MLCASFVLVGRNSVLSRVKNLNGPLETTGLKCFPDPKLIRFDDEGAFRGFQVHSWLEGL